jgi:hypothetical protein
VEVLESRKDLYKAVATGRTRYNYDFCSTLPRVFGPRMVRVFKLLTALLQPRLLLLSLCCKQPLMMKSMWNT